MEALQVFEYEPKYQPHFEKLSREWIEKYFVMEPIDEAVVTHPEEHIIDHGGAILFASFNERVIGTVALKKVDDHVFELCKMAVDEGFRGHRAGFILGEAALKKAKESGAKQVILYSQTTFNNGIAINLYNRLGFKEIELEKGGYDRCNIKMLYDFEVHDYLALMAEKLRNVTREYMQKFVSISSKDWNDKISKIKWSRKEILGHLIDSASNNHQRFVRAQLSERLEFPRYLQDGWVTVQNYQHHNINDVIDIWRAYNMMLASVIENVHHQKLETMCVIGDKPPVTLKFLIEDYLDHLLHHLDQIVK